VRVYHRYCRPIQRLRGLKQFYQFATGISGVDFSLSEWSYVMTVLKPLVSQHADGVLRVFRPKRTSTVARAAAVEAQRQDDATWLGGVYAGPVAYCDYVPRVPERSKTILGPVTELVNGPCDLVLVGDLRDLTRNSIHLLKFARHCIDNGVRLIAWREGIDNANDEWETMLHIAALRSELMRCNNTRRRKGVASPKP
jgi:hypothetical protein